MAENERATLQKLDDSQWRRLDELVERLEARWRLENPPDLAELVGGLEGGLRERSLVELIKVDQEYRFRRDQPKSTEEYLGQWPELRDVGSAVRELVLAECLTRAVCGSLPELAEIERRFPGLATRQDLEAVAIAATEEASRAAGSETVADSKSPTEAEPPPHNSGAPHWPFTEGQVFGRYRVERFVGRGGMGNVFLAFDNQLGRQVALKIPHRELLGDKEALERFRWESRAAAGVRHPHVCPIYDAGNLDEIQFISMAFIRGATLEQWLEGREVSPKEIADLALKITEALIAVHDASLIHRDIKASNVMIDESGQPILMDFGLARDLKAVTRVTDSKQLVGTLAYMAPEQADLQSIDVRTDIYSIGVLLYQLLTRRLPYRGTPFQILKQIERGEPIPPRQVREGVDPGLEAICLKAMSRKPVDRFSTARDLAEALGNFADHRQIVRKRPPGRRAPVLVGGILLVALFALILALRPPRTATEDFAPVPPRGSAGESQTVEEETPLIRWIDTDPNIGAIRLSPDQSQLFVAYWEDFNDCRIQVFDAASGELLRTIRFGDYHDHGGMAISPDGRYLFTTNFYQRYISRLDLQQADRREDLEIWTESENGWAIATGLTPDGSKLVVGLGQDGRPRGYSEENDRICVVGVADGDFALAGELRMPDEVVHRWIGFSDDSRFAYVNTHPRQSADPALCEVELSDPPRLARRLAFPGSNLVGLAVSGDQIYVSQPQGRKIHLVDRESLKIERAFDVGPITPECVAIDPAGKVLAALCHETRALLCLDSEAGTVLARVEGLQKYAESAIFSRNGRRLLIAGGGSQGDVAIVDLTKLIAFESLAFASNRDGGSYQVYLADGESRHPLRLTENHAKNCCPRFSPDGSRLAFVSDQTGVNRIHLVDLAGNELAVLQDAIVCGWTDWGAQIDWSPDGRRIAYISVNSDQIRAVEVRTSATEVLLKNELPLDDEQGPRTVLFNTISWKNSGDNLVFAAQHPSSSFDQEIFSLEISSGRVRRLTNALDPTGRYQTPSVSPDGSMLCAVYHPTDQLVPAEFRVLNCTGGEPSIVCRNEETQLITPAWHPDGRRLVFVVRDGDASSLCRVGLTGGPFEHLTDGPWDDMNPDLCDRPRALGGEAALAVP